MVCSDLLSGPCTCTPPYSIGTPVCILGNCSCCCEELVLWQVRMQLYRERMWLVTRQLQLMEGEKKSVLYWTCFENVAHPCQEMSVRVWTLTMAFQTDLLSSPFVLTCLITLYSYMSSMLDIWDYDAYSWAHELQSSCMHNTQLHTHHLNKWHREIYCGWRFQTPGQGLLLLLTLLMPIGIS